MNSYSPLVRGDDDAAARGRSVLHPAGRLVSADDEHPHSGDEAAHDHSHGHGSGRREVAIAAAAGLIHLAGRIAGWTNADLPLTWFHVVAAALAGSVVIPEAVATLRSRHLDVEVLMIVAAIGAAILGHWSDTALLLVLFALGHSLEAWALGRATRAIGALGELAPATAHRKAPDGTVAEVDVDTLIAGDVVLVRPGERIAADGVVVAGQGTVDEAAVTGESLPAEKEAVGVEPGEGVFEQLPNRHRVFAGTLNGSCAFEVRVVRPTADSTLARVVELVEAAESAVSPSQLLARRIVAVFVPAVLLLVAGLLVVPPLLGEPFRESFERAMAVLVASSPCALAIATPAAVLAAIARAARNGVLVKGGEPLELLAGVRTVAFDKTGTLTIGQPTLVAVHPAEGINIADLLGVAVAVESSVDHPLARAVVVGAPAWAAAVPQPEASGVEIMVGKGAVAIVDGRPSSVGSTALGGALPEPLAEVIEALEAKGASTMVVRHGDAVLGVLGVSDTVRPDAADAVAALETLGIGRAILLSGDHQRAAAAVGSEVGITAAFGGLLPEGKVAEVHRLRGDGGVAMVGDGVNDAPALATATVGIAMGAAGSDLALETADIALLGDRLDRLPFVIDLARRTRRTIHVNLGFSLAVVAVLIPLTILGVGIGPAVIAHEGSTLVVVANGLLLLAARDRFGDRTGATKRRPTP